jgi:hypothetical protein
MHIAVAAADVLVLTQMAMAKAATFKLAFRSHLFPNRKRHEAYPFMHWLPLLLHCSRWGFQIPKPREVSASFA